ncbi:hypothetical protein ACEQ8H_006035 [Pleosporales sp. CAS-2024a]
MPASHPAGEALDRHKKDSKLDEEQINQAASHAAQATGDDSNQAPDTEAEADQGSKSVLSSSSSTTTLRPSSSHVSSATGPAITFEALRASSQQHRAAGIRRWAEQNAVPDTDVALQECGIGSRDFVRNPIGQPPPQLQDSSLQPQALPLPSTAPQATHPLAQSSSAAALGSIGVLPDAPGSSSSSGSRDTAASPAQNTPATSATASSARAAKAPAALVSSPLASTAVDAATASGEITRQPASRKENMTMVASDDNQADMANPDLPLAARLAIERRVQERIQNMTPGQRCAWKMQCKPCWEEPGACCYRSADRGQDGTGIGREDGCCVSWKWVL